MFSLAAALRQLLHKQPPPEIVPTTRSAPGTPRAGGPCVITRETPTEYVVRLVTPDGAGDEIGRLVVDPLTGGWAAMPADTTQPVLGIYQRGSEAIQAIINQDKEHTP